MSKTCYICSAPTYKYDLCSNCYTATSEYQFTNESFKSNQHLKKEYFALIENIKKNPKNVFIEYLYELEAMAKVMRFRFYDDELDRRVKNDILDLRKNFNIKAPRGVTATISGPADRLNYEDIEYRFPAEDGHILRNRAEVDIDNWLFHQLTVHAYGKKIYLPNMPNEDFRCGFYLPEAKVYIEFFDDMDTSAERRNIYKANQLNFILLDEKQVGEINTAMPALLKAYFPGRTFL